MKKIATVGRVMYEELRSGTVPSTRGRMVVIDLNTGDCEIGEHDMTGVFWPFERNPRASE